VCRHRLPLQYFPNKESLVAALIEWHSSEIDTVIETALITVPATPRIFR